MSTTRNNRGRSEAPASSATEVGAWLPFPVLACVALLGGLLFATAASAQNYGFLRNTPVSRFDATDMRLYTDAARRALEAPELGQPVRWKNDKTGSEGSVTATAGTGEGCRTLTVENRHKMLSARGEHHVCKIEGQWKAQH